MFRFRLCEWNLSGASCNFSLPLHSCSWRPTRHDHLTVYTGVFVFNVIVRVKVIWRSHTFEEYGSGFTVLLLQFIVSATLPLIGLSIIHEQKLMSKFLDIKFGFWTFFLWSIFHRLFMDKDKTGICAVGYKGSSICSGGWWPLISGSRRLYCSFVCPLVMTDLNCHKFPDSKSLSSPASCKQGDSCCSLWQKGQRSQWTPDCKCWDSKEDSALFRCWFQKESSRRY